MKLEMTRKMDEDSRGFKKKRIEFQENFQSARSKLITLKRKIKEIKNYDIWSMFEKEKAAACDLDELEQLIKNLPKLEGCSGILERTETQYKQQSMNMGEVGRKIKLLLDAAIKGDKSSSREVAAQYNAHQKNSSIAYSNTTPGSSSKEQPNVLHTSATQAASTTTQSMMELSKLTVEKLQLRYELENIRKRSEYWEKSARSQESRLVQRGEEIHNLKKDVELSKSEASKFIKDREVSKSEASKFKKDLELSKSEASKFKRELQYYHAYKWSFELTFPQRAREI